MLVTLVVVGSLLGTLDLAAMAGGITLIGTGVDDQIIIPDGKLRKKKDEDEQELAERNVKERLKRAFEIVLTTASVAIVTMLPLFASDLVEIRGFAFAAIVGIAVGQLVTRPAYGVIIGELFRKDKG